MVINDIICKYCQSENVRKYGMSARIVAKMVTLSLRGVVNC